MEIKVDRESMVPKYFVSYHKIYYVYCKDRKGLEDFLEKSGIQAGKIEKNAKFDVWCVAVYDPRYKVYIEKNLECA
jgi:hypothetical protein